MNGRVDAEAFWLIVGWNHQHDLFFFFLRASLLAWNLQSSISFVAIFCFSFPSIGITGMYAKLPFFFCICKCCKIQKYQKSKMLWSQAFPTEDS